jgi:ABC-type branched-subunit amino acid transport system substrate-binding protein
MVPHGEKVSDSYVDELRNAFARKYGTKPLLGGHLDVLGVFSYPEHAKIYVKEAIDVFECKNFLFSDGTKSEELAASVGPEKLAGMMGTSPGITSGKSYLKFKTAYNTDYGELPTTPFIANAYDAMAVIGLAAYAAKAKGLPPTSASIRDQLRLVAKPPGTFISPGEFQKAFKLLDSGKDINYEGASGTVDFDENGDVVTPIEIWKFDAKGKIVTFRMETQIPEE